MNRMHLVLGLVVVAILVGCAPRSSGEFSGKMTGKQAVPAVATKAGGQAQIIFDRSGKSARYVVYVSNVQLPTGAYIHLAPSGQVGPAVVTLWEGSKEGHFSGKLAEGVITDASLKGLMAGQSIEDLKQKMSMGRLYVGVSSARCPEGEIRGQLR